MTELKVMKAPSEEIDLDDLFYPCLASIKYDGIRCIIKNEVIHSSTMRIHPNTQLNTVVQSLLKIKDFVFDGELYTDSVDFEVISGLCRAYDRDVGDLQFHCWDMMSLTEWNEKKPTTPYSERSKLLTKHLPKNTRIKRVKQTVCNNREEVDKFIAMCDEEGHEGAMFRDPNGVYKHGKASLKQANLVKFKFWKDYDAKIISVHEMIGNKEDIERELDPTGHRKTVHKKEDKEGKDMFGYFIVEVDVEGRPTMKIGGWKGLTHELRKEIWDDPKKYIGRWLRFKSMKKGEKDLPRIPKEVQFRDDKEFSYERQRDENS